MEYLFIGGSLDGQKIQVYEEYESKSIYRHNMQTATKSPFLENTYIPKQSLNLIKETYRKECVRFYKGCHYVFVLDNIQSNKIFEYLINGYKKPGKDIYKEVLEIVRDLCVFIADDILNFDKSSKLWVKMKAMYVLQKLDKIKKE